MRGVFVSILLLIFCGAVKAADWRLATEKADYIHRSVKQVTDVIVHDIYSPPVASRIYAYVCIAGYEAGIFNQPDYISLAGQLHQLSAGSQPNNESEISPTIASVQAILSVAKTMVISEEKIEEFNKQILNELKNLGVPVAVYDQSVAYGRQVAKHIIEWSVKDQYKETRALGRFAVSDVPGTWVPTPPSYKKAIEPYWNKMRTFLIDSAQQFKPIPPPIFSTQKTSVFYKNALAVKNAVTQISTEQSEIANFWDCNPFKMNIKGHVMFATKKISPGGHWINITQQACKQVKAGVSKTLEAYAIISITLADCFISCWDEKYRSNVVRPETYINQYMDADWVPLLQTPPFPEYTSGHSVVSAAAAVILTKLFGNNFKYTDSTELEFGLPPRKYLSFTSAAKEAAISRFYGGIHYMPAITNGLIEGKKIGLFMAEKLKTRIVNPKAK